MSEFKHPCLTCGACCSYFFVSFDARELTPEFGPWQVPDYLTIIAEDGSPTMLGTDILHRPRCTALAGRVGKSSSCQIYSQRPGTCRNFKASYEGGIKNPRCDEARAFHALPALTPADWESEAPATLG
jgi:Fe-S-cluster containining protein